MKMENKRTEKKGICYVLLCVVLCGTTLCGCKFVPDVEKDGLGSYTYGEEESQCSDTVQEETDSEEYLEPIREANRSLFSEINGAWFVEDSDRFAYCETYRLPHDGCGSVTGKIQLAEMKGTDALAEAVNRYHEELYESRKAQMQVFQEEAAAMDAEEVRTGCG